MSVCQCVVTVVLDVNPQCWSNAGIWQSAPWAWSCSSLSLCCNVLCGQCSWGQCSAYIYVCVFHFLLSYVHMGVFTCNSHRRTSWAAQLHTKVMMALQLTHSSPHGSLRFIWLIMLQCEDTGESSWLNMRVLLCSGRHTTHTHSMTHYRQTASHVEH